MMQLPEISVLKLSIAGLVLSVEHQYQLSTWFYSDHEAVYDKYKPQFTVRASHAEVPAEYRRLNGEFSMAECESNCLYRKVCFKMLDFDAFLLHAAAVAVDGEGYVFTAPGGTGKSTHASYWLREFGERAYILNGDKPIIRHMNSGFYVCGTPWRGKEGLGNAEIVPLKAVCLLERGKENEITLADIDTAIDNFFRQVLIPNKEDQIEKQLDLLDRLMAEVPVYRLKCNMSDEAALVAYDGIKTHKISVQKGW